MIRFSVRFAPLLTILAVGGVQAEDKKDGGGSSGDGTVPQLDFAYSILAQQRGQREEADKLLEKARVADPEALPLVQRSVSQRMQSGDRAGALKLYRDLAAKQPERIGVQLLYANFLRESAPGDDFVAKDATVVLEAAHKRAPQDLQVIRTLFRLYEQREKRESSLGLYKELAEAKEPSSRQIMVAAELAKTLFSRDDTAAQERLDTLFREGMKRMPMSPSLARAASEHFRDRKNLPESIEMLRQHTQADPSSLDLRTRLGILLLSAGKEAEGEKELLDVVAINSRQALAHQSLAKLYRQQDRVAEALPHAAQALKIRGGSEDDFIELANEFMEADRPRDARLLLEKAVYQNPDNAALAARLAIAARRDPETRAGASRLFREAEALSPAEGGPASEPDFLVESCDSLLEGGQTGAAEDRLRRAIRAFPPERKKESAAAMRRLAGLWQDQGKNGEAGSALRKRADALDPPP